MDNLIQHIVPPGGRLEDFFIRKVLGAERLVQAFEYRTQHFYQIQQEVLLHILRTNEGTLWGRRHQFSSLTPSDWSTLPVNTYKDVEPYILQIQQGHWHALTAERPSALATSTGTTSRPKLIPMTPGFLQEERLAQDLWNYLTSRNGGADTRRILSIRGDAPNNDTSLVPLDSYQRLLNAGQRPCIQKRYVFPRSMGYVKDLEHRFLVAAQAAFVHQPTILVAVIPRNPIRIMDLAEQFRKEIFNATEGGTYIGTDVPIGKIPDRDRVLRQIRDGHPLESVQLLATWLGGTQSLFVDELKRRGIHIPMRDLGLVATEGRFSIPLQNDTPFGVLNPFGPYYEFMTPDKGKGVPLQDLVEGREYNLVITGLNGLYRYDMEDLVRIEGWYHEAPLIRFMRKDLGYSSIAGEKLHENHVVDLLSRLEVQEALMLAQLDPPHYVLCLREGYSGPLDPKYIDGILGQINFEYSENLLGQRLHGIEIRIMKETDFTALDKQMNPRQDQERFKRRYLFSLQDQGVTATLGDAAGPRSIPDHGKAPGPHFCVDGPLPRR